jgi:hypothetical protein
MGQTNFGKDLYWEFLLKLVEKLDFILNLQNEGDIINKELRTAY